MSTEEIKAVYLSLKDDGDLTMFQGMTGDWEKDKKSFTNQYKRNEEVLDELFVDEDDDDLY